MHSTQFTRSFRNVTLYRREVVMLGLGATEMVVLLIIVLVLFGGSRLPGLMKGMGEGIRGFKQGMNEDPAADKKIEAPK
jgi:sec-independent protein translocase protein TatA